MSSIEFTGIFPEGLREVELCNHDGGGEGYHIYIDKYYQGAFHRRKGKLVAFLNDRCTLDADQVEVLAWIIDQENGAGHAPAA